MRSVAVALTLAFIVTVLPRGIALGKDAPPASIAVDLLKKPMFFYVAKGGPNACGPGCNEWIAAEGIFDLAVAARLRAFLSKQHNRNLPIYFYSPGGLADHAFSVGRILRERGMTAGVSRTLPDACKTLDEKACGALKRSGQTLKAELNAVSSCNSACVYALVGAKERRVPPGARLGVHSGKLLLMKIDPHGRIISVQSSAAKSRMDAFDARTRKYIAEMGVDTKLYDIASSVPHESGRYLSRDEIAALKIDPRAFQETGWMVVQSPRTSIRKLFLEAKGPEHKEHRVSLLDFSCGGSRGIQLVYIRGLSSDEGSGAEISGFVVDGKEVLLLRLRPAAFKMDVVDTGSSFDRWDRFETIEFLESVAKQESLEIGAGRSGRRLAAMSVKLSTAGLSDAVEALRKTCSADPYFPAMKPGGLTQ